MRAIKNIIYSNNNIESCLKCKIFILVNDIIEKYPSAYNNLIKNLQTIIIKFSNEKEKEYLCKIGGSAYYIHKTNTMVIDNEYYKNKYINYIIVHELLHVASYGNDFVGFLDLNTNTGISLNEGITELLTKNVYGGNKIAISKYIIDTYNVKLFSCIIPFEELVNMYFTKGLSGLYKKDFGGLWLSYFEASSSICFSAS